MAGINLSRAGLLLTLTGELDWSTEILDVAVVGTSSNILECLQATDLPSATLTDELFARQRAPNIAVDVGTDTDVHPSSGLFSGRVSFDDVNVSELEFPNFSGVTKEANYWVLIAPLITTPVTAPVVAFSAVIGDSQSGLPTGTRSIADGASLRLLTGSGVLFRFNNFYTTN